MNKMRTSSLWLLFFAAGCLLRAEFSAAEVNPRIGYVRKEIPPIKAPACSGKHYEAMVPETLDLARRADLAINAITECTDAAYDHEVYINCYINRDPPLLTHSYHGFNGAQPKILEALPLLRIASGSRQNQDAEQVMIEAMLHMFGEDGMYYMPIKGRPWALFDEWGSFLANAKPPENAAHIAALWPTGRALLALEAYASADPKNPVYREYAKRTVDGLNSLLNDRGKWGYFPGDIIYLDEKGKRIAYSQSSYGGLGAASVDKNTPPITGLNAISFCGPSIQGAAKFYAMTGYEPARKLAEKLSYWIKDVAGAYNPDGSFTGHFHLHVLGLIGMAETGSATGDRELLDFASKSYEFARSAGVPLVGHFPEHLPIQPHTTDEGCGIADMVILAFMLSRAGYKDYWEDVDRYVRNEFSEMQLVDNDWIDRAVKLPESKATSVGNNTTWEDLKKIKDVFTDKNVQERTVGAFATWASINDWYPGWTGDNGNRWGWCGCCLGNGARAVYYAWESILEHKGDTLKINLLLSRASRWADVDSHIPYVGKVEIKMKEKSRLLVRIPEWVDKSRVTCKVNGKPGNFQWESEPVMKQYVNLGAVDAGKIVAIEFPMVARVVELDVPFPKEVPHARMMLKGNDVVDIWPKGVNAPFYQRAHYKENRTLWKKVDRFSPAHVVNW